MRVGINLKRFGKILLVFPFLFTPSTYSINTVLFKPIIGQIPIERVISTI